MEILSSTQRRSLRARAHALDPVVVIGAAGLTSAVLAEIERNLAAHELIKIRVPDAPREERNSLLESICRQTGAAPVQHIGKILVVWRASLALEESFGGAGPSGRHPRAGRRP